MEQLPSGSLERFQKPGIFIHNIDIRELHVHLSSASSGKLLKVLDHTGMLANEKL